MCETDTCNPNCKNRKKDGTCKFDFSIEEEKKPVDNNTVKTGKNNQNS
ncbi:MAG: hypothetical protein OXR68_01820 [Alphaproteobacteria bacterium]|nr:hypothetical protein [Alphaproteobacteria bacterium]